MSLVGVILAGGKSRRMGSDKGLISYWGKSQHLHCAQLLRPLTTQLVISLAPGKSTEASVDALLYDPPDVGGPAAGILAAHRWAPQSAVLVLAVDMPLFGRADLSQLLVARGKNTDAIAFVNEHGTIEPLASLWEISALHQLEREVAKGNFSPRRCLESIRCRKLQGRDLALTDVDTPEKLNKIRSTQDLTRHINS